MSPRDYTVQTHKHVQVQSLDNNLITPINKDPSVPKFKLFNFKVNFQVVIYKYMFVYDFMMIVIVNVVVVDIIFVIIDPRDTELRNWKYIEIYIYYVNMTIQCYENHSKKMLKM